MKKTLVLAEKGGFGFIVFLEFFRGWEVVRRFFQINHRKFAVSAVFHVKLFGCYRTWLETLDTVNARYCIGCSCIFRGNICTKKKLLRDVVKTFLTPEVDSSFEISLDFPMTIVTF